MSRTGHFGVWSLTAVLALFNVACGGKPVDERLVARYESEVGGAQLELQANGEYTYLGIPGGDPRTGTWGAEGAQFFVDETACSFAYDRTGTSANRPELTIRCPRGASNISNVWQEVYGGS